MGVGIACGGKVESWVLLFRHSSRSFRADWRSRSIYQDLHRESFLVLPPSLLPRADQTAFLVAGPQRRRSHSVFPPPPPDASPFSGARTRRWDCSRTGHAALLEWKSCEHAECGLRGERIARRSFHRESTAGGFLDDLPSNPKRLIFRRTFCSFADSTSSHPRSLPSSSVLGF